MGRIGWTKKGLTPLEGATYIIRSLLLTLDNCRVRTEVLQGQIMKNEANVCVV
jgi:hypothetical protein